MCTPQMAGRQGTLMAQSMAIPQGEYSPVEYKGGRIVPTGSKYHSTPVRYDQQMRMFAPVRSA